MKIGDIEFVSPNDFGAVIATKTHGKVTYITRERGLEKFTSALDPMRCKLEVVCAFPRKIIDLRQVKYIIKRRKRNANLIERTTKGT